MQQRLLQTNHIIGKAQYDGRTLKMKEEIELAVIAQDIKYIQRDIQNINNKLENQYVTQAEFEPIKKIVYGLVMLVLTTVCVALVSVVLK